DKPRFRARGPKSPSGARNHREPTRGQQNASPIVIRLAAVSISRSDGPLCGEDGSMLDSGATERLPPERNPAPAKAGQYSRFVLVLFLERGNPRVRSKENGCARDGVLRCLYVEGAGHDVQRAALGFFVASGNVIADQSLRQQDHAGEDALQNNIRGSTRTESNHTQ